MTSGHWHLDKLALIGRSDAEATVDFVGKLNFIYGASNTGKSLAVKLLDFMFAGSRDIPQIKEREPYESCLLDLKFGTEAAQLRRALRGGDVELRVGETTRVLSFRHNANADDNLSNYLLGKLGIQGRLIAKDKSGTKKPLSFRDIVRFCIVDETSILSEASPAESGEIAFAPLERNVFKFMITGEDDSALVTQLKPKDYRTSKTAQVQILEDMMVAIDADLTENFPDWEKLDEQYEAVQSHLEQLEGDIVAARQSVKLFLDEKRQLIELIGADQRRLTDLAVAIENFEQLAEVYASDVARLESIEEAGFLLGVDRDKACPVCGAPPEAQVHHHSIDDLDAAREAAEVEIAKIRVHQSELAQTMVDAQVEMDRTSSHLLAQQRQLDHVERQLQAASPSAERQQEQFADIIPRRDRINRGLALVARRGELEQQRKRVEAARQAKPSTNFQYGLSTAAANDFSHEVSRVLEAWGFPGQRKVFFDLDGTFDLVIDGKRRRDNGKGVRAITHAAFKVAMLSFCRSRGLPHPGFLVMDSALITYRDPISSREGPLAEDEKQLTNTDLKELLFEHLGKQDFGQVILFDNVDPPKNAPDFASIERFTNSTVGRQGLL